MKFARSLFLMLVAALGFSVILPARADVVVYDFIGTLSTIPGASTPLPTDVTLGLGDYVAKVESAGSAPFFEYLKADFFGKPGGLPPASFLGTAYSAVTPPASNASFSLTGLTLVQTFLAGVPGELIPGSGFRSSTYEVTITQKTVPVPEPTTWLMLTGGLGLLGWLRLRKSATMS